jgi:hypothetical protein
MARVSRLRSRAALETMLERTGLLWAPEYPAAGSRQEKRRPQAWLARELSIEPRYVECSRDFFHAAATFTFRYREFNDLEINRRLIRPCVRHSGSCQVHREVASRRIGSNQFQPAVMRFGNPQGYRQS